MKKKMSLIIQIEILNNLRICFNKMKGKITYMKKKTKKEENRLKTALSAEFRLFSVMQLNRDIKRKNGFIHIDIFHVLTPILSSHFRDLF